MLPWNAFCVVPEIIGKVRNVGKYGVALNRIHMLCFIVITREAIKSVKRLTVTSSEKYRSKSIDDLQKLMLV